MPKRVPRLLSPTLSGVAGEYLVAGELTRRGYVASLTLRNTRGIDILASNQNATKSVGIQVKTVQGGHAWILSVKTVESRAAATNLVFVFVRLQNSQPPEFHVVPRRAVKRSARQSHKRWMSRPRRDGKPHKDSSMRAFSDPTNKYLNRWDLLGLD